MNNFKHMCTSQILSGYFNYDPK